VVDSPSVREKRLARELRQLRTAAGLHGKDVAATLGWSPSKVSRVENGRSGIGADDLERLLALYAVPDLQAGRLRRLAPAVRPRGWWDAYADELSAGYANLIRLEAGSRALRCYAAVIPHALLLTPEYLSELISSTEEQPPRAEVDRRVLICRRRQDLLDAGPGRPALRLSAVVDQSVLLRSVVPGDPQRDAAVRRGQLERILAVADRPNATVQVLPFTAGLPPVTSGSFSVLDSGATGSPDVVYLENKTRVFFVDAEAEVQRYTRAFGLISEMALDPGDSRSLLEDALAALGEQPPHLPGSTGQ
jgi:transcriptional regulator with XRE-family HTH domain